MTICRIARGKAKSIGLSPWKTPLEAAFIGAGQAFEEFVAILADKKLVSRRRKKRIQLLSFFKKKYTTKLRS